MNDYEYAQRVMEAAGVEPRISFEGGKMYADAERFESYPDPLTSADAFLALWDALEAKGWRVEFRTLLDGTLVQVYKADEMGRPDLGSIFQGGHEDRKAALVQAAGQALGVSRAA